MGCSASRFEKEKSVTGRCRNREHAIKRCVQNQHAFAAAHAAYMRSLKNTGAALRQFGEGGEAPANPQSYGEDNMSLDTVKDDAKQLGRLPATPYFPPPLPHFFTPSFLSRTFTMPPGLNFSSSQALTLAKSLVLTSPRNSPRNSFTYTVEESREGDAKAQKCHHVKPPPPLPLQLVTPPPAPPISKSSEWELYNVFGSLDNRSPAFPPEFLEHGEDANAATEELALEDAAAKAFTAENHRPKEDGGVAEINTPQVTGESAEPTSTETDSNQVFSSQNADGAGVTVVDFARILKELDDNFLLAYESCRDVARLLEAQRTHYHSSCAGSTEPIDHASRVLRVMSWGRHTQFASIIEEPAFFDDDKETHASTLDKLLAWEKKLHDEVKAGEVIRIKLERKSVQLKNKKKRDHSAATMSKTKAVVKSLQTKYLVEVQAVDAASSEVEKLRDDFLHMQLVDLVQKSMRMWGQLLNCHQQQYRLIQNMQFLDNACTPTSTNELHIKNTLQLESEINIWHHNLEKLIAAQKGYMSSVHRWLRLHILEIKSGGMGVPGSPEKRNSLPVYALCESWLASLDQILGNVPLHALNAFSQLLCELKVQQAEELKQKKKLEQLKKELEKKEQVFKARELRYKKEHMVQSNAYEQEDQAQERGIDRSPLREEEVSLRLLREKVDTEHEKYEHLCLKSGNMTLSCLQRGFPPVLIAMQDFASSCAQRYTELYMLTSPAKKPLLQINY